MKNTIIFIWMLGSIAGCGSDSNENATPPDDSPFGDTASGTGEASDTGSGSGETGALLDSDPAWDPTTDGTVEIRDGGVEIVEEDGTTVVCYETLCDGRLLACGDCIDNDDDGKTDWRDQECLGPCDNTEGPALISDVGGVTGSTCHVDCYFDYGNGTGTGSDDCWWDHQCDPLEPEAALCPYDERVVRNEQFCPETQSELCEDICLAFTPNGCDCFGCCTFPALAGLGEDGADAFVWIGAKDEDNVGICTFDDILDPEKCPRCTPQGNCYNECGRCEICIGKTEIPADCYDDTTDAGVPEGQCPEDVQPCGLDDQAPCEPGYYCVSGCCQTSILMI